MTDQKTCGRIKRKREREKERKTEKKTKKNQWHRQSLRGVSQFVD
jgi:hypothetical protein